MTPLNSTNNPNCKTPPHAVPKLESPNANTDRDEMPQKQMSQCHECTPLGPCMMDVRPTKAAITTFSAVVESMVLLLCCCCCCGCCWCTGAFPRAVGLAANLLVLLLVVVLAGTDTRSYKTPCVVLPPFPHMCLRSLNLHSKTWLPVPIVSLKYPLSLASPHDSGDDGVVLNKHDL